MSSTSTPEGARAQARAMGDRCVLAMPTVPPTAIDDPPEGVAAGDVTWREVLGADGYAWRRLPRGTRLQIDDLAGNACVSLLVFNDDLTLERLNVADTMKVQWSAVIGEGQVLLSDQGRVLLSLLRDTSGRHDPFCGPSAHDPGSTDLERGPLWASGRSRLLLGLARRGLDERDLHGCLTLFKGVRPDAAGDLVYDGAPQPGRSVLVRADMNVFVVLANCRHPLDRTGPATTPVRLTAWRGAPAGEGDPVRTRTPEAARAFLNVDEYFSQWRE